MQRAVPFGCIREPEKHALLKPSRARAATQVFFSFGQGEGKKRNAMYRRNPARSSPAEGFGFWLFGSRFDGCRTLAGSEGAGFRSSGGSAPAHSEHGVQGNAVLFNIYQ